MYVDRKNQWVHCFYRLTSFNYHQLSKYGWTMVGLSFKKWVWINASWWKKTFKLRRAGEERRVHMCSSLVQARFCGVCWCWSPVNTTTDLVGSCITTRALESRNASYYTKSRRSNTCLCGSIGAATRFSCMFLCVNAHLPDRISQVALLGQK